MGLVLPVSFSSTRRVAQLGSLSQKKLKSVS